ncbi:hypothetical protein ACQVQ3_24650 [Bacillus cereus]|uniref:hypothetical protein n=1 Tax=Bacillus cereus group TaxID=86661 RepID=UPI000A35E03A|nr:MULTISPECIES: hypothetical protein [Bacillus cereus group]MDX5840616.1 hypothetical protein [Bacillus cereus group sp. BfR-BA-01700]MED2033017.1 hypothetical protein [Bacillus thuringiensis]MED2037571.1 hypothetical protein [Bacillus wiedmannii]MED2126665.1 hypothetical protein [Bacillus thuringiensis]MED2150932.1 hypothetical protein [Bacillus thuringiensis]
MSNVGYEAGKGRTFTPSIDAKWINEFNEMKSELGISRNKLTEKLIQDGLKFNRNSGSSGALYIPLTTENLSQGQIEMLSSSMGQEMLLNLALTMIGGTSELNKIIKTNNTNEMPISDKKDDTIGGKVEVPSAHIAQEIPSSDIKGDGNESNVSEQIIKPKVSEVGIKPKSAALKALEKYNKMKSDIKN